MVAVGAAAIASAVKGIAGAAIQPSVTNPVPATVARVVAGDAVPATLGRSGAQDVFVTAASDIAGLTAEQLSSRLAIPPSDRYVVIEFFTPPGIASPVNRANPGFIPGGLTGGGAREFVVPNGPLPAGASVRVVR